MNTDEFTEQLAEAISHAILAHSKFAKGERDKVRFSDMVTPYSVHPIWCAMTLLAETALPEEVRQIGYQALLWHDTLEDTTLPLPQDAKDAVKLLVEEMTFSSFKEEKERLWGRSDMAKLLKLYDKVSNLLDGRWMSARKWNDYVDHTLKLMAFVEKHYGELNIVRIARAVCIPKA